ncbi:MAG: hypothetical protein D6756_08055 [Cyanobacteria bacterium J083]|nr:MAG: hypothetical protein D6756_08055 [Cyanobacteria bacterium J083]
MPTRKTPSNRCHKQDTLVVWQLEREVYILALILLVGIIFAIGLLNQRVENVLLFALFLSCIIIALVFFPARMKLLGDGRDWKIGEQEIRN